MRYFAVFCLILGSYSFIHAQSHKAIIKKADSLISITEYDKAESLLNSLKDKGSEFEKAITQTSKGFLYLNKGRYELALENLQEALNRFQSSGKQDTPEGAKCLSTLGLVYGSTGKYKQAEENHRMALQIRERIFGSESEEVAASYNDLGLIYFETDPDKALEYFEKALEMAPEAHRCEVIVNLSLSWERLADGYVAAGLFDGATLLYQTSLDVLQGENCTPPTDACCRAKW